MLYADYLSTSEMQRWIVDVDIDWDAVNAAAALEQPGLLDRIRDSALIESYFPLFTTRAIEVLWDDPAATAIFSVQLYESYRHFHVFNLYLERVGYRPIADAEIVAVRERNAHVRYTDATALLTRYMMTEHVAAFHFARDARESRDRVLSQILRLVARDELRHTQFAYELLASRIRRDPGVADAVLAAARNFQHVGLDVVAEVPGAGDGDFAALAALGRKLKRLTGRTFHLVETVHAGPA